MTSSQLDYRWNLRPLMADRHLWKATELVPLLRDRGIGLSASQVRRLVTGKPERLSMTVLVALCDIFGCTPGDLITIQPVTVAPARRRSVRRPGRPGPRALTPEAADTRCQGSGEPAACPAPAPA